MQAFGGCPNRTWRVTMDTGLPIIARLRWSCRWSTPQTVFEDTAGVAAVIEKFAFSIVERSTLWHPVRAGVPPTGLGRLRSSFRFCTEMRLARSLIMAGFSGRFDTAAWRPLHLLGIRLPSCSEPLSYRGCRAGRRGHLRLEGLCCPVSRPKQGRIGDGRPRWRVRSVYARDGDEHHFSN